ncbi:hypothetical protein QBC38DRAFT_501457 [Podospora fimiseda]|uniref:Uncharacterized protein n=1 Tax=Podospora fimiseda TaxID=252190 RepID=A0AAN7BL15_9PEZI|nr:hypothetical protein QBC38DRAFT_501457 [Podospora fimiseda]
MQAATTCTFNRASKIGSFIHLHSFTSIRKTSRASIVIPLPVMAPPRQPFTSQILPAKTFYSTTSGQSVPADNFQPQPNNKRLDPDDISFQPITRSFTFNTLTSLEDQFPASYRRENDELQAPDGIPDVEWIEQELNPKSLHQFMKYLWLAGRPVPPRPLHYQLLLGREIIISESIDHHLVWGNGKIYIKPLPKYMLNPRFWTEVLVCQCPPSSSTNSNSHDGHSQHTKQHHPQPKQNEMEMESCHTCPALSARQNALGLLLHYASLITHESDFTLAIEKKLLLPMEWPKWRLLIREFLSHSSTNLYAQVSLRFIYGELRLNRLNFISLLKGGPTSFLRGGYMRRWNSYGSLYRDNSNMILAATAYILLALSAMQVGLGTTKLMDDELFQNITYGFTVFSIVGPLGMLGASVVAFVVIILVNLVRTRRFEGQRAKRLQRRWRGSGGRDGGV